MNKNEHMKVDSNLKSEVAGLFIQEGDCCLGAAKRLFESNACFMFPAAILCHHGVELLLKACWIWDKCEYAYGHYLPKIAKNISFLQLSNEHKNLLKKIDTYYFTRYPMSDSDYDRVKQTLISINDQVTGIQVEPGEIGTDDWDKVLKFYQYLIQSMPDDLYSLYDKVGTTIELN